MNVSLEVKLIQENNCLYLTQNIEGCGLYQRTKFIRNFINNETKVLEDLAETEIRKIFAKNGINIYSTDKSALNLAFDTLNRKGKEIVITDLYKDNENFGCVLVGMSANEMSVWLEDDKILQCGVMVEERKIK